LRGKGSRNEIHEIRGDMKCGFRGDGLSIGLFSRILHRSLLFFVATGLLTSGCSKSSQSVPVTVIEKHTSPQPPQVGSNTLTFRLINGSTPITGAHVELEGDMTHAGMAPVFGSATEVSSGQYQGQLVFTMGGDWVVLMHIALPGGRKLEEQMNINGVQFK
jgi:hypothetical protein